MPLPLECLDGPTGGMCYHFVNPNNIGEPDPTRPQALIYEPEPRRSTGTIPRLHVWALRAWVWRGNPRGVFADYNPNVSCRYEL